MSTESQSSRTYALLVIGAVSCSMLMYEILLTRVAALRLMFHFAFLAISNCLLGIGASGSLIFIYQERMRRNARLWVWILSLLYLASLLGAYAFLIRFHIPDDLNFTRAADTVRFIAYNLAASVPFFFGGGTLGWILTVNADRVNRFYGVDLVSAGLGCWLSPLLLWKFGAGGCFLSLALLALVGLTAATPRGFRKPGIIVGVVLGIAAAWFIPRADRRFPVPGKDLLDLTHAVRADLGGPSEYTRWSATGRIDLLPVDPDDRFIFCRGEATRGWTLPEEKFILQDGSAGTFILDFSGQRESLGIMERSLYSAAVRLKSRPRVFVIGAGGGNDVWAAWLHGARSVTAVELNEPILDIHRTVLRGYSRDLLEDPRIRWVHGEGRSVLQRTDETFDVIQMTGVDTWTSLTSGAYVLAENYLYTTEALRAMYRKLEPEGIIQITRFAADMEALRIVSIADAALGPLGVDGLDRSIACLKTSDGLMAFLIKKGPFSLEEQESIVRFAVESGIRIAYLPARLTDTLLDTFVRSKDKAAFARDFPRDISPTTDDRPYFFSFSRWRNPLRAAKNIWEPTGVSQGNPLFILAQLGFSVVLAGLLILLPLGITRTGRTSGADRGRTLMFFSSLGLGFIALEISFIQKLTLFLGHPIYAITVTLFTMLVFTGIGSLISGRWFHRHGPRRWLVPAALTLLVGLFLLTSPALVSRFIGFPVSARILLASAVLSVIGLVLGVPFAYGVRLLNRTNPGLVPWAWAINAYLTVIGSILTVVLSMNFGFRFVMAFAVAVYWIGFALVPGKEGAESPSCANSLEKGTPVGARRARRASAARLALALSAFLRPARSRPGSGPRPS